MTAREKQEFWKDLDPRQMRSIGDRLLAESLPHVELSRAREEIADDSYEAREKLGWTHQQVGEALGVTAELVWAWEEDRVKAPECLPLVLQRILQLQSEEG